MNPHLSLLQAYPFERLRQLFATVTPNPDLRPISLGIGEPRHATPALIKQAYCEAIMGTGLAGYPATAGDPPLREAIASWLQRRYQLALNPSTQVLPINGSREALFAFAQTMLAPSARLRLRSSSNSCMNPKVRARLTSFTKEVLEKSTHAVLVYFL